MDRNDRGCGFKAEVRTMEELRRLRTQTKQKLSKPTCIYRTCKGFDPLDPKGRTYPFFSKTVSAPKNRIIEMNELLELKHRIDNCTDDLQSFELRKIYDKLLVDLWESGEITLSEMQSMSLPLQ